MHEVYSTRAVSQITSLWTDDSVAGQYLTGVSLHSHTSCSEESLQFVHKFVALIPFMSGVMRNYDREYQRTHGAKLDFVRAFWRPPLLPKMAYDLEAGQIRSLGLEPLVSITDHDTIEAPMLLRTVPSARHTPVSVEWSAPYGSTEFHLGIHNLPSSDGTAWMRRFAEYTKQAMDLRPNGVGECGSTDETDRQLLAILRELDETPGVLVVLNHPIWDLHGVGDTIHHRELCRFVAEAKRTVHAMELNGLRHAKENRAVMRLARETGHLLISGGDRHGLEPNANINLTSAGNFREFVNEIRVERRSHILFMPQYAKPWEGRILQSTLNAVTDFPEFIEGWQHWDERAFHPDVNGEMRPLRALWSNGQVPWPLRAAIALVRLGRNERLAQTLTAPFWASDSMPLDMELR